MKSTRIIALLLVVVMCFGVLASCKKPDQNQGNQDDPGVTPGPGPDNGGEVESIDKWGVKKLAYAIDYKTEGYYVLMTFQSEPTLIAELDRVAGINENVLRRLITKRNA